LNSIKTNSSTLSASIVTVSVGEEQIQGLIDAAETIAWVLTTADFESYISAARRPNISQQIKSSDICIAIVDFDKNIEQAVESVLYLRNIFSGKVSIVALSKSKDPEVMLVAMRNGCNEFLAKTFDQDDLIQLFERLAQQRDSLPVRNAASGTVLSFFGAKGGVGSTTLAVHLALYLVQCHQKRTLIIDNHPELGHICVYLGIDGTRFHFHELVRNVTRLDSELLRGFTAKHSSGLEVLSSPDVCGGTRTVDGESVSKLLEFLRTEYDYIVVDCSTALHESDLAVLEGSDHVYLVATPELGAIRDLSRYVDNLTRIETTTEKMHVVINRFSSRYAVKVEQIEKAIRLPIAIRLPNSYTELVRSVNLGEPIAPSRKSEFSMQFIKWAASLAGAAAPRALPAETKSKSFFGFLSKQTSS
jgi:pilus assembly protein CpaE